MIIALLISNNYRECPTISGLSVHQCKIRLPLLLLTSAVHTQWMKYPKRLAGRIDVLHEPPQVHKGVGGVQVFCILIFVQVLKFDSILSLNFGMGCFVEKSLLAED